MEKIYDLVQTSNFKFQISSTNAIHFFFFLQRYFIRSIIENSPKNIFWKEFFLWKILYKYLDKRDYPIKGTIERIFHSRSEGFLKRIAKKVVPTLVPLGPILFPGIRERYKRIKKNKNKKKTKHLWNGNLWYASRKVMLTSAAMTQKSSVTTPLRSFLSYCTLSPFAVMARVSWNHPILSEIK